jgi:PAS domain S-box-containing protein
MPSRDIVEPAMYPQRAQALLQPEVQPAPTTAGPLEAIGQAALLLDDDRIRDCNQAASRLFALNRRTLIGKTIAELSPSAQTGGAISAVLAAEKLGQTRLQGTSRFRWLHSSADGTAFLAEVLLASLDALGAGMTLALIRDVTAREMAQAALQDVLRRSAGPFDTHAAIFLVEAGRIVTAANPRTCRLLGLSPDELIGRDTRQLHPSSQQFLEFGTEHYPRLRQSGAIDLVRPLRRKDGTALPLRLMGMDLERSGFTDAAVWVAEMDIDEGTRRYCRDLEETLDELTALLTDTRRRLADKGVALREVLATAQDEQAHMGRQVASHVETAVMPLLDSLRGGQDRTASAILDQVEHALEDLAGAGSEPPGQLSQLTPTELQICKLIRRGLSSKEIATIQSVSAHTVQTHRRSIRGKLNIKGEGVNLTTFLRNLHTL